MSSNDSFFTVAHRATGIYKEKGSSFMAQVYPLRSEAEVKIILSELKKEHPKARHICYGYRFGPDQEYHRINDDGEPSGTAGRPILGQLIKYDLENTLITIVRYFGGTLLGASGLGNAYKSAAENAISNAKIVSIMRKSYFGFEYKYSSEKFIESCIRLLQGRIESKSYSESVKATISFPITKSETVIDTIREFATKSRWSEEIDIHFLSKDHY